jgi:hypothetical protein
MLLFRVTPLGSVNLSPFGDWDAMVWVWQGAKPGSLSKLRSR